MPQLYGTHLRSGNTQCRAKCCVVSCTQPSMKPRHALQSGSITENNLAGSDNIYKGNFCAGFPFSPSPSCPRPSPRLIPNPNGIEKWDTIHSDKMIAEASTAVSHRRERVHQHTHVSVLSLYRSLKMMLSALILSGGKRKEKGHKTSIPYKLQNGFAIKC